ncbi:MAG TPA: DUF4382 domain-containing protein, partial [Candidatus Bathyarchaeia archaeon]|nr:DUF4382 domain-containing protein [Candidatus Bathyarchaeia archaeon]
DHLYIRLSSLELHTYGFGPAAGWVNVNQTTQPVDLIHAQAQFLPQLVASASLTSGRYDAIRLFLTNSTALIGTRPVSLPKTPILSANLTLPIQPKGFGDVLLLVSFDYSLILANPASLSMQIVQTSTT